MSQGLRPAVRLNLPAHAEGVGVVRQALSGMADALAVDPVVVSDMKMAVSEACTNVVVHAYDESARDEVLEVDLLADDQALTVVVRDEGIGLAVGATRSTGALGLGLPLIAALSDGFEVRGSRVGGTEVEMTFLYVRDGDPVDAHPIGETGWEPPGPAAPDAAV